MPLFKEKKYSVKGKSHNIRFNVDAEGLFWCSIKPDAQQATGLGEKEYASTFKDLEARVCEAFDKWWEAEVVRTYHIKYRLCLSRAVKHKLPDDLMDRKNVDLWKKTSRLGSEYHPEDSTCMIFDWKAMIRETSGEIVHEYELELATDESYHMGKAIEDIEKGEDPHSFHTNSLYKPFESSGDDTIFERTGNYWNYNDDYYLEIPLTPETWKFFTNIDDTFLGIFTGMLRFLGEEPEKLVANISKVIESGNMNLITSGNE